MDEGQKLTLLPKHCQSRQHGPMLGRCGYAWAAVLSFSHCPFSIFCWQPIENHIGQWTTGTLWCSFIPKGDPLVFISYQIDPKFIKKWLTYGYFPSESLHDSIANHMGQKGTLWCSFVPKRSKIRQETADLWLFSHWDVMWFHWEPQGTKRDPLVFICTKKIHNPSRKSWVMAIALC